MIKKITGGMLALALSGGLLFAQPACAQTTTSNNSSSNILSENISADSELIIIQGAAEILGTTPLSLIMEMYKEKKTLTEIIEEYGMGIDDFIAEMRNRFALKLEEMRATYDLPNKGEFLDKYLSQFPLAQIYALKLYDTLREYPAVSAKITQAATTGWRQYKRRALFR
ncbi:MAG: hypothetical protein V1698_02480 [bacterium]